MRAVFDSRSEIDDNLPVKRENPFLDGIVDVDQEIAEHAAQLRAKDLALRFPDGFMAATAQTYDDGILITTDDTLAKKVAPELVELVTV